MLRWDTLYLSQVNPKSENKHDILNPKASQKLINLKPKPDKKQKGAGPHQQHNDGKASQTGPHAGLEAVISRMTWSRNLNKRSGQVGTLLYGWLEECHGTTKKYMKPVSGWYAGNYAPEISFDSTNIIC